MILLLLLLLILNNTNTTTTTTTDNNNNVTNTNTAAPPSFLPLRLDEVLAGALHDECRALVVGATPSFGKGLVQAVFGLGDGSGLVLTVARYQVRAALFVLRLLTILLN